MDLNNLAQDYLKKSRYQVSPSGKDFIVANRPAQFVDTDTVLVWTPDLSDGTSFASREGPLAARFNKASQAYPTAKKYMLVSSFSGLSREFRQEALKYGVSVRVPIQFFDTPFKHEESDESAGAISAAKELSARGTKWSQLRVKQPCTVQTGQASSQRDDVLDELLKSVESGDGSRLSIIVGPAGVGKTVMFEVLFSQLYKRFMEHKKKLQVFPRPLPLIPQYIRSSIASTIDGLVDSFLHTELVAPIEKEAFIWMIANGYGIWLIDGLDEFIEKDPTFFSDRLLELLNMKTGMEPMVILSIRDSLIATNVNLRDFLDEYNNSVTIYELAKWQMKSKVEFAKTRFSSRAEADSFIKGLQGGKILNELSSTPYYCKLISDEFKDGSFGELNNETILLQRSLRSILKREYDKGLLDKVVLPMDNLIEVLQDLSSEDATYNFGGLTTDVIRQYAEIAVAPGCDDETLGKIVINMKQLAVFSRGNTGQARFSQEILAQHMLGERLVRNLRKDPDTFMRELSNQIIPSSWVTLRTVANLLERQTEVTRLAEIISRQSISDNAFRNILQIIAFSEGDQSILRHIKVEHRSLTGVHFEARNLEGISYRQCDLTDVVFDRCVLKNCLFDGALIHRTAFIIDRNGLKGAKFGSLDKFHSLYYKLGSNEVDLDNARKWLLSVTGIASVSVEPCAAAQQVRYLFGKFVHPDGKSKNIRSGVRGLVTGKKYINPKDALDAAIRHGYLFYDEQIKDCVNRCEGQKYNEMVEYVKTFRFSDGIRHLLDDTCSVAECSHGG